MQSFRSCSSFVILLAGLGLLVCSPDPAAAQQQFELTDQLNWQPAAQVDPDSPQGKIHAMRRALAEQRPGEAQSLATAWIDRYPNHPLRVEAYLVRADAKAAQGSYYNALFDYEVVIRQFPATAHYFTAIERELRIAELYASGVKRRWLGMRILDATGEAEEIFIRTQERAPGSDLGRRASMMLADYYYRDGRMRLATEAYDLFLENYGDSPQRERAMLRLIQAAAATFKGPEFDATGLLEARARLQAFLQEFPATAEQIGARALLVRIDESMALKLLSQAQWYQWRGEQVSANYLYRRLLKTYPQTAAGRQALDRLTDLGLIRQPGGTADQAEQPWSGGQTSGQQDSDARPQPPTTQARDASSHDDEASMEEGIR